MKAKTPNSRVSGNASLGAIVMILILAGITVVFLRSSKRQTSVATTSTVANQSDASNTPDELVTLALNRGKSAYEKGDGTTASREFQQALTLAPTHPDARLNLANAQLLANQPDQALATAAEVLKLQINLPSAHYIQGCAWMRKSQFEEALKSLQQSIDLEPNIAAVSFQLGRAHYELGHHTEAVKAFQEAIASEPDHPAAHYALSQAYVRLNQLEPANQSLELHKQIQAKRTGPPPDTSTYERCKHTAIRLPFKLEQPDPEGVKVAFVETTDQAFRSLAPSLKGPIGVIDVNHRGVNDLFVLAPEGFRLLFNSNGVFHPSPLTLPASPDGAYRRCLVADLQNDRYEDVIVLGEKASHVFKFATNGLATEVTAFCGLKGLTASSGELVDLDFSGKLDLITTDPTRSKIQLFRNLGNLLFRNQTTNSGIPSTFSNVSQITIDDWNNDDLADLFVGEPGKVPSWLAKQRGGKLTLTNSPASWPQASVFTVGDLNNDLQNDLIAVADNRLVLDLSSGQEHPTLDLAGFSPGSLQLVDYDNDGWLDIIALGKGLRCWRNAGKQGFKDVTSKLGLDQLGADDINSVNAADFDGDGAPDLLLTKTLGGLRLLKNQGANANQRLKVQLFGNRSNASGLGIRLELVAGGWRTVRTVHSLPIEIGVGKHTQLDSVTVRWFDLAVPEVEVKIEPNKMTTFMETILPTGSCPYVYVWTGDRYEFVSDILGAAPLGLPVAENHYIPADTDELVWIGNSKTIAPRDGAYSVQITEELREVLYLDEAKLWVVDHPNNTEILPTSKLLPGPPFPAPNVITVDQRQPLRSAFNLVGEEVTAAVQKIDKHYASPQKLRAPQLRGLAEPHGVILDFGQLALDKPWILALNGWLRFGGGMANISASLEADLPFPFPVLEAEDAKGAWTPVPVSVGAPAGKTKEIFVDLTGKLPVGTQRLKITAGFEIHWDRIALFQRAEQPTVAISKLKPTRTDLHWRGFSEFRDLPWTQPLTPEYTNVFGAPKWTITPSGWCTRYGPVDELIAGKDNALALLNGGDELTLDFDAASLPELKPGYSREFFLFTVGWDKDSDFHVARGWTVGPLPFHGQNDQTYGHREFEQIETAPWTKVYNTRYVGPLTLKRAPGKPR